jgi:hypothetical protein
MSSLRYAAFVETDGKMVRVFPRSKKTSLFDSPEKAEKALELVSRRLTRNGRGHIVSTDGLFNFTMAL